MSAPTPPKPSASDQKACLIRTVSDAIASEPSLEALRVDRAAHTVSVATLGPKSQKLEQSLAEQIQELQNPDAREHCALFDGTGDCSTCPRQLEADQLRGLTIEHTPDTTTIARVTCPTAPKFWKWRQIPWPKVVPRTLVLPDEAHTQDEWKQQIIAAALCAVFGITAYFMPSGPWKITSYILSYLTGGWFPFFEVLERLRKRILDVHFLMLAVAIGSASIGAWSEGAVLLFLFSFSGALEHYAMGRTEREIESLFKLAPKEATVLDDSGAARTIAVEQLQPGMLLLIKPGDQVPVDAKVVKGRTAADESNFTGEAAPVDKDVGDTVFGGTLNIWGAIEASVLRPARESAVQKIIHLVREAQHSKAPAQQFTDKFSTGYTYLVLGLSLGMYFVWWLGFGYPPFLAEGGRESALYKTMALLVVSSPCALVLSIPSAVLAAIAWAARRGILFRGGSAVERLAEIQVVAMDKTGTLTTGELHVEKIESFPAGRENGVAQLAYSLERFSTHPLARTITRYGDQQKLPALPVGQIESIAGMGLRSHYENQPVLLGRRSWIEQELGLGPLPDVPPPEPGFAEVWVAHNSLTGRILLRDDIRPQARGVIDRLKTLGLRLLVLTGDRASSGRFLKKHLDIDDVRAELKPENKVEIVQSFAKNGQPIAMIGDGVNDAPSLAAANVAVAMGARGSDAALEQADVVLMQDRLENFLTALQLSRRARRIIRQNLVISLGTVIVLVAFALAGRVPLTVGVIGHEGSTLIVVLNSLRLLFGGRTDHRGEDSVKSP